MDFARHANQGYNGRRATTKFDGRKSSGRSDRTYADKQRLFSDEFMSGDYKKRKEREKEEEFYQRGRGMSQRSSSRMSHRSFASHRTSVDDPAEKYEQMMRLGYNTEDKESAKISEYISTLTPPRPPSVTQDKYMYDHDTGSSTGNDETS